VKALKYLAEAFLKRIIIMKKCFLATIVLLSLLVFLISRTGSIKLYSSENDIASNRASTPVKTKTGDWSCTNVQRPSKAKETYTFQYTDQNASAFVYSAFYDQRKKINVVKIVGLVTRGEQENLKKYCQLWFNGQDKPLVVQSYLYSIRSIAYR